MKKPFPDCTCRECTLIRLRFAGAKGGIVTSRTGSLSDNGSGGDFGYRASKAAANAIGKPLAPDLKDRGIAEMLLHPG